MLERQASEAGALLVVEWIGAACHPEPAQLRVKDLNFVHPSLIALVAPSSRRPTCHPERGEGSAPPPKGTRSWRSIQSQNKEAERILGLFILPSREVKPLKFVSTRKSARFFSLSLP